MTHGCRLGTLVPLVRYVDEQRAVVEARFSVVPALEPPGAATPPRAVAVQLRVEGEGFEDVGTATVPLEQQQGRMQFEIADPQRWWPAGMGPQPLYRLSLRLVHDADENSERSVTFGLTSVRRDRVLGERYSPSLLVNGSICDYHTLLEVDGVHEGQLLPAAGETLLLVRDHFGSEPLYEAADRVGLLLIQCVPLHPEADAEAAVAQQISRLVAHPSLAGYYVGHWGSLSDRVAQTLRQQDPTRSVFRRFPLDDAA